MIEKEEAWALLRTSSGDALVLAVTFLLVIFRDLTEGILVGFALGSILFIKRMSDNARIDSHLPLTEEDHADIPARYDATAATDEDVVIYRIQGAFFFGAVTTVGSVLDRIATHPRAFVIDFTEVPFLDSSAARMIVVLARKLARHQGQLFLTGTKPEARRTLVTLGLREPAVRYCDTIGEALSRTHGDNR